MVFVMRFNFQYLMYRIQSLSWSLCIIHSHLNLWQILILLLVFIHIFNRLLFFLLLLLVLFPERGITDEYSDFTRCLIISFYHKTYDKAIEALLLSYSLFVQCFMFPFACQPRFVCAQKKWRNISSTPNQNMVSNVKNLDEIEEKKSFILDVVWLKEKLFYR